MTGFEPAAFRSQSGRATKLRHIPSPTVESSGHWQVPRIRYDELAETVRRRLPACGAATVVAVDGPSGAGKSEVADRLGRRLDALVLRVDELVPGWRGLAAMPPMVAHDLLAPIAAGDAAAVRRWNWVDDRPGDCCRCCRRRSSCSTDAAAGRGSSGRT